MLVGLNPFRTGQCLSTQIGDLQRELQRTVLIPFVQGSVFRLNKESEG